MLVVVVLLGVACDENGEDGSARPADCGLPSPEADVDVSLVPEVFLPDEAEVLRAERERGGFLAMIGVPLGVQDALGFYRRAVRSARYEVIQADNEGFEAELYLRKGKFLAAIQIRTSKCDDESVVFVNVVDAAQIGGGLPSPSPAES